MEQGVSPVFQIPMAQYENKDLISELKDFILSKDSQGIESNVAPTIKQNLIESKFNFFQDEVDIVRRTTATGDKAFPMGPKAVKVVYRSGYSSTPEDLKLACFDLVKYYLKDERKERLSIAGASIQNPVSTTLRENIGFPDHIKRILDFYKVHK